MKKAKFVTLMATVVLATASGAVLADEANATANGSQPSTVVPKSANGLSDAPGTTTDSGNGSEAGTGESSLPVSPTDPNGPSTPGTDDTTETGGSSETTQPTNPSSEDRSGDTSNPDSKPVAGDNPTTSSDTANAGTNTDSQPANVDTVPTPEKPVKSVTGATIVGTTNGQVIIANADGTTTTVAPETVGGKVNADKTITITDEKGQKKTLPSTGDNSASLLSMVGMFFVALAGMFVVRGKHKA